MYQSSGGGVPFQKFMDKQEEKMQKKIEKGFQCMLLLPGFMKQPHIKHFSIERYNRMYEYRERIKVMVRIIFMIDSKGDIILLHAFIKRNERDTMQALDVSMKIQAEIDANSGKLIEYMIGDKVI